MLREGLGGIPGQRNTGSPERGSELKRKHQELQGRTSAGSRSQLPPRRGPFLRASFLGWLAQHFPPWWSCSHKLGCQGGSSTLGMAFSFRCIPPAPATAAPWSSWARLQIATMPNASWIVLQEAFESLNYLLLRFMCCNRINHEDLQGLPSIISLQEGAEGPWCHFIPSAACLEANIQQLFKGDQLLPGIAAMLLGVSAPTPPSSPPKGPGSTVPIPCQGKVAGPASQHHH